MVSSFRTPSHVGTVKRSTTHYDLEVPYFDTPTWGQYIESDLDTIDALLFAFAGISNVVGVWDNATGYTVGQRVVDPDSGFIYECKVNHTSAASGTFAADRLAHPTYWLIMQTGWSFRGAWTTATAYLEGDIVYDTTEHVVAVATSDHTSTTDIRTDAANWDFIVDLATTVTAAETAETNAETAETNAETAATTATTQAGIATTKASEAATSAANALTSENNAETAETNAETAETGALAAQSAAEAAQAGAEVAETNAVAALDEFTDLYLGPKAADPTLDNDGNPLQDGALYWNTTGKLFKAYDLDAAAWFDAPALSVTAESVEYNNATSGLTATNIQDAVDEIAALSLTDGDKGEVVITGGVWELETSAILTRLLTVDGSGSALDSDLLDGQHGSYYLARANHTGTQSASTISDFNTTADGRISAAVGVSVQAWSANLDEYATVNPSAYTLTLLDDANAGAWLTTLGVSAFAQTLLDDAAAGNVMTTLGITANGQSLITAANYAAMRALLDLEAGTDFYSIAAANAAFQPLDADLTTLAGLTATTDNFIVSVSSAWASRTPAQVKTTLALNNVDNTSNATERAATATLSNKRFTPRVTTITSNATPTVNTDTTDIVNITALAAAITSMTTNLSGTPVIGDVLIFQIKDNGTGRAITWGASFTAKGVALPTTTVANKLLTTAFIWNGSNWGCVGSAQEA